MSAPTSPRSTLPTEKMVERLETLSPRHRDIVRDMAIPVLLLGFSETEVADVLGLTSKTVRRCLAELREELERTATSDS